MNVSKQTATSSFIAAKKIHETEEHRRLHAEDFHIPTLIFSYFSIIYKSVISFQSTETFLVYRFHQIWAYNALGLKYRRSA